MSRYTEIKEASHKNADIYTLKAGDIFEGSISSSTDNDTIALSLKANTSYRIEVTANHGHDQAGGRLLSTSGGGYITHLHDGETRQS